MGEEVDVLIVLLMYETVGIGSYKCCAYLRFPTASCKPTVL